MAQEPDPNDNRGKWNAWYRGLSREQPQLYGNAATYLMAAAFLADVEEVEDWGCGKGGFSLFCLGKYVGIDGSDTPFASRIADLRTHRSNADGILLRHVLEHNHDWEQILAGAVASFRRKLCLVLFTPFAAETTEISHNRQVGIDAPTLSLARADIEAHFAGLSWRLIPDIRTPSEFGIEHVYLVWRGAPGDGGSGI
jgi:hypothetical protein